MDADAAASSSLAARPAHRASVEEAFIYDRTIDQDTYKQHRSKLVDQLAQADLRLKDALVIDLDAESVLAFAERLLVNAAAVWREANDTHQRAFQLALFPEGLPFDGENFGTALTCLAFSHLREGFTIGNGMASPPGSLLCGRLPSKEPCVGHETSPEYSCDSTATSNPMPTITI